MTENTSDEADERLFIGSEIDPDILPQPVGWRLLIEPINVEEMATTESGIILADNTQKSMRHLRYVGKVLAMGHLCYRHAKYKLSTEERPQPWCKVGDWVVYNSNAGQEIRVRKSPKSNDAVILRVLNDDGVLAVTPNPDMLATFF